MILKVGTRLKSTVCTTEVVVVRAPAADVDIRCGGSPMAPAATEVPSASIDPSHADGTAIGKRYHDPESGLEVLCTRAGEGSLSLGDRRIEVKDAKPLPSSD